MAFEIATASADDVARVMDFSVMYDWRMHGNALPMSSRLTAIGRAYQLPDAGTVRRAIDCPAPAPAGAPANATSTQPASP